MKSDPPQSTSLSNISHVIEMMLNEDVGAVVIVEENRPVGIITEKDILRRVVKTGRDFEKSWPKTL